MLFWRLGKTFSLTLPELTILVTITDMEIGAFFFSWTAAVIWRDGRSELNAEESDNRTLLLVLELVSLCSTRPPSAVDM